MSLKKYVYATKSAEKKQVFLLKRSDSEPTISFIESLKPALKSGCYELELKQTVSGFDPDQNKTFNDKFEDKKFFIVRGERWSVSKNDVISCHPAINGAGSYSTGFPHIIFKRATLPWDRSLSGEENDYSPWLMLLVFTEEEHELIKSQEMTVQQFINSLKEDNKVVSYPKLKLETGETESQLCTILDIPVSLFNKIAPSFDEMQYLAHVRQVDVSNKSDDKVVNCKGIVELKQGLTEDLQSPVTNYSVILANRIPLSKKKHYVYLVSVEGLKEYLPKRDAQGNYLESSSVTSAETVRLVSLFSWSFNTFDRKVDFHSRLENLNISPSTLRIEPKPDADSNYQNIIEQSFNRGYVALSQDMRYGDKIVSWYRGPLAPFKIASQRLVTLQHVDSAYRYDQTNGLFDVSYSAAWQLGRNMSLQDAHFTHQIIEWRKRKIGKTLQAIHRNAGQLLLKKLNHNQEQKSSHLSELALQSLISLTKKVPKKSLKRKF